MKGEGYQNLPGQYMLGRTGVRGQERRIRRKVWAIFPNEPELFIQRGYPGDCQGQFGGSQIPSLQNR